MVAQARGGEGDGKMSVEGYKLPVIKPLRAEDLIH